MPARVPRPGAGLAYPSPVATPARLPARAAHPRPEATRPATTRQPATLPQRQGTRRQGSGPAGLRLRGAPGLTGTGRGLPGLSSSSPGDRPRREARAELRAGACRDEPRNATRQEVPETPQKPMTRPTRTRRRRGYRGSLGSAVIAERQGGVIW